MRRALAPALVLAFAAAPGVARAEVRELADRVEQAWKVPGATTARLPARFVYEDETVALPLPPLPAGRCTSIVVIGPRGMSFHVRSGGGAEDDPLDDRLERASSVAGAAEITRCATGGDFSRLHLTSDAGRGAVEIVLARADDPVKALKAVLPERTGPLPPPPAEPGGPPPLLPPTKRADGAEARARAEGAARVDRWGALAGDDGADTFPIVLGAGCHRFELFGAERPDRAGQRKGRLDLDAELRADDPEAVLAKDRSEAADARLEACVGEPTDARVGFAGAGPQGTVVVVHAAWALPAHLPILWGPQARARMAQAIIARHALAPTSAAVLLAHGATGTTPVPLSLTPGACYLAVAAIAQGAPHGVGMRLQLGPREITDERGQGDDAGLVAFCAGDRSRARLDIETRGAGVAWGLAVFRAQSGVWP